MKGNKENQPKRLTNSQQRALNREAKALAEAEKKEATASKEISPEDSIKACDISQKHIANISSAAVYHNVSTSSSSQSSAAPLEASEGLPQDDDWILIGSMTSSI